MCEKGTKEGSILELFQDPRYIPDSRPLKRELPHMPIIVSRPYPESNPGAWIQRDVSFFSTGEYTIDEQNNIYFKDPYTDKDVYLNKIDTTSYTHKTYATYILNDLSRCTNTVRVPETGRDTTVYARGGIGLYHAPRTKDGISIAHRKRMLDNKGKHVDRVEFNIAEGVVSNLYAILNTFRHEYIHVRDERDIAYLRDKIDYKLPDLEHAEEVYKAQMTYEEFKKAPVEFQKTIINSYIHFVMKGCREKGIRTGDEVQRKFFDNFNRDIGEKLGASITRVKATRYTFLVEMTGSSSYTIKLYQEN
jgi:hypothetical protein